MSTLNRDQLWTATKTRRLLGSHARTCAAQPVVMAHGRLWATAGGGGDSGRHRRGYRPEIAV